MRYSRITAALVLLGIIWRIFYALKFRWFLTVDEGLSALIARMVVQEGYFPVVIPSRHTFTPFSSLLVAILSGLGILTAQRIVGIILSSSTCVVLAYFARRVLPERASLLAVGIIAFPPIQFLDWSMQVNGYALLFFLMTISLILSLRKPSPKNSFLLGFVLGFGFWTHPLIVVIMPSVLIIRGLKHIAWLIMGFILGALPLIAYNVYNFGVYRENVRGVYLIFPTLDDVISRIFAQAGSFAKNCSELLGRDFFSPAEGIVAQRLINKTVAFVYALNLLPPVTELSTPFILYALVFIIGVASSLRKFDRKFLGLFSIPIILIFTASADRFFLPVYIVLPVIITRGFYLLGKPKFAIFGATFLALCNISQIFVARRDCSGMLLEHEFRLLVQTRNFACDNKNGDPEIKRVVKFLRDRGVNSIISHLHFANVANAYFYPDVKATSLGALGFDWTPFISEEIKFEPRKFAYVYGSVGVENLLLRPDIVLERYLLKKDIPFKVKRFGTMRVFWDIPEVVHPSDFIKVPLYRCTEDRRMYVYETDFLRVFRLR